MAHSSLPINLEQVRVMTAAGILDREIAAKLHVSLRTLRRRRRGLGILRQRAFRKLGVGLCSKPILESALPKIWATAHFADVDAAALVREEGRPGWRGMPSREVVTHRGYGGTYSSAALDL